MRYPNRRSDRPRPAFTLIELLVVIVILALLVGLLVPAIMNAINTANNARVSAEIQAMSQALASFKNKYNDFPPSRIVCAENGDYSLANLGGAVSLGRRTTTYLKKFWPRINLSTAGPVFASTTANGGFYDFNGNGRLDIQPYILAGPECLVLFLGGLPQATGAVTTYGPAWSMTGFSKNPVNPFQNAVFTTNRTPPEFDFNNGQLVSNVANATTPQADDAKFPGYCDPLGKDANADGMTPFYVYFSAYGGAGYDPNDGDSGGVESDTTGTIQGAAGAFLAPGSIIVNGNGTLPQGYPVISSPAPNPYTTSAPIPTQQNGQLFTGTGIKPRAWQNANTYQIISPGRDRYYGIGGQYVSSGNRRLPFLNMATELTGYVPDSFQTLDANAQVTGQSLQADERTRENDNITNFAPGRLD